MSISEMGAWEKSRTVRILNSKFKKDLRKCECALREVLHKSTFLSSLKKT